MSSATVPIALDEAAEQGRLKPGDHVMMVAFGAGFTWASTVLRW
jgi:3-oxoacyl-[acyl-carrier-protein] synthase-3